MNMTISYSRQGDVHTIETGGAALPKIVIDNTGVPENQRGGTAKQLLGSAAVFCYMSALLGSLDARGVKYEDATATATEPEADAPLLPPVLLNTPHHPTMSKNTACMSIEQKGITGEGGRRWRRCRRPCSS